MRFVCTIQMDHPDFQPDPTGMLANALRNLATKLEVQDAETLTLGVVTIHSPGGARQGAAWVLSDEQEEAAGLRVAGNDAPDEPLVGPRKGGT